MINGHLVGLILAVLLKFKKMSICEGTNNHFILIRIDNKANLFMKI